MVWSANVETGEVELKEVTEVFEKEDNVLVHLTINGNVINTTALHPFYVVDKGWTEAIEINVGDKVLLQNGTTSIVEDKTVEQLETPIKVYNFTVDDFHTYFVGEDNILVHNASCGTNGIYEDAPYHGANDNPVKSRRPTDGQAALDNSVEYSPKGNRVGISNDEFVVLMQHVEGVFHGHVREWSGLTNKMKAVLIKAKMVTNRGKIL